MRGTCVFGIRSLVSGQVSWCVPGAEHCGTLEQQHRMIVHLGQVPLSILSTTKYSPFSLSGEVE